MFGNGNYLIFICKIHNKIIHYFKREDSGFNETQCWDCIRDANTAKWKKNKEVL